MLNRKSSNYSPQSFSSSSLLAFLMVLSQCEPCMSIMSRWSPSALMECSCMACCSSSALSRNPSWHSGQIISDPLSDSSFLESSFLSSLLESAKRWHENHEIMHFLRDYFYPMHPLVTRCRLTLLWNAFICDRLQWLAVVLPAGAGLVRAVISGTVMLWLSVLTAIVSTIQSPASNCRPGFESYFMSIKI